MLLPQYISHNPNNSPYNLVYQRLPRTKVRVRAPATMTVHIEDAIAVETVPIIDKNNESKTGTEKAATQRTETIGWLEPGRDLIVTWRRKLYDDGGELVFTANHRASVTVSEAAAQLQQHIQLDVIQGNMNTVNVAIPTDWRVHAVLSENLVRWQTIDQGLSQKLVTKKTQITENAKTAHRN